jgi:arsenate reductase (thioredoxin)
MSLTHSAFRCLAIIGFCFAAFASGPSRAADTPSSGPSTQPTVVFICSHGTIKSLMAAQRFNKIAAERGISVRAISRAANDRTVDKKVPDKVAAAMEKEGYYVDEIVPQVLTHDEAAKAAKVVHISLEDPADDPDAKTAVGLAVQRWDGIPSGLRDYPTARKMIDQRVDAMVEEFAKKRATAAAK